MADQRMTFILEGRDRLSREFDQAGRSAERMADRVEDASRDASAAVDGFTRDARGRLRDARGRFVAAGDAARLMGEDTDRGSRRGQSAIKRLMSALGALVPSAAAAGGALKGVGVAAAVTAAPALSALVPMLAGAAAGGVAMKLTFAGVGDAVKLAGEDAEGYREALKKMGPDQRAFTKQLVGVKKEFRAVGKELQKDVLPNFTRALKDAKPTISAFKGGVKQMGGVLEEFADEFGALFASGSFAKSLEKNLDMGADFFKSFAAPMADFTRGLLRFGESAKPVLDSFSKGFGGLMSRGLPGFFDGLSRGAKGSAAMFDGLFGALNRVLPAIGEFLGRAADALGPALRDIFGAVGTTGADAFKVLGAEMSALKPVFGEIGAGVRIVGTLLGAMGRMAKDAGMVVLQSFWPSFGKWKDAEGPLKRLSAWLRDNKAALLEVSRVGAGFLIGMVDAVLAATPTVIQGFRYMATAVLTALDGIVSGAAAAWGWIPGIGAKLQEANTKFDKFKNGFISGLHEAEAGAAEFAAKVRPRLEQNKLKMDIANWSSQIEVAKDKMKTVPPEKRAALKANIQDLEGKVAKARRELASLRDKTITVTTFFRKIRAAGGSNQAAKNAYETSRSRGGPVPGYASGGHVQALAAGGFIQGPGTTTSDSILGLFSGGTARVSDREYVIRAAAVRRYGTALFDQLNQMRVPTRVAARQVGREQAGQQPLIGSLTVNAGANASADDIIGAAMYRARVARRGGVHA